MILTLVLRGHCAKTQDAAKRGDPFFSVTLARILAVRAEGGTLPKRRVCHQGTLKIMASNHGLCCVTISPELIESEP